MVNKRLKTAQNKFCEQFLNELPTSKEQWSFIKKGNGKESECLVIDKLVNGERHLENELDISNCLNRSFQKLGVYNGQYVSAPNISRFRTITPGVFNAWSINAAKFAIRAHLRFVFNTCISQNIFPENLKLAFICPVNKNGDLKKL